VWECPGVRTDKAARENNGATAKPLVSPNVSVAEAIGTLLTYHGTSVLSVEEQGVLMIVLSRSYNHPHGNRLAVDMSTPEAIMDAIAALPNPTSFMARFPSTKAGVEATKLLSFVKVDSVGIRLPDHVRCGIFKTNMGAAVVIGGTLSDKERLEVFELLQRHGRILSIAVPAGVEPLPFQPEPKKKPSWKLW